MIGGYTQPQLDYLEWLGRRQDEATSRLPAQIGEYLPDVAQSRRMAQLYVQSHFPQYSTRLSGAMNPPVAPAAPVARVRAGRGRHGYGTYSPQSTAVNIGGALPTAAPVVVAPPARTAQVVYPNPSWSYPMSAEEIKAEQDKDSNYVGTMAWQPGYQTTKRGYMFAGDKEDWQNTLADRDAMIAMGAGPLDLEAAGLPPEDVS